MTLIEELAKRKIIDKATKESLIEELKSTKEREEEILLERGLVSEDFLFNLKSYLLGLEFVKVAEQDISSAILDVIPRDSAEFYKMVPLKKEQEIVTVGMVFPDDLRAQEALKFLSRQQKFEYKICLITLSNFKDIFKKYQSLGKEVSTALEDLGKQLQTKKETISEEEISQATATRISEAPISKMVAVILRHAVDGKASDIHIEPLKDKTRVRFRLDGSLHSSLYLPKKIHAAVIARIKILSNLKIDETRIPQDGRFSIEMDGQGIDFRVSSFPTMLGEKIEMRVLNSTQRMDSFESLGLGGSALEAIKEASKMPYGMILATGPTGCGKTTTLYILLESLNKEGTNIVTLEDPIEYYIEGVNQSQVKPEIGYTFANGLRNILRQDPNVIMVGEIRDSETADLAIHAALTGHIVISTLHTNNAVGVIPRLIDLGVKPFLVPATLRVALAQRLVRRSCQSCKTKIVPDDKTKEMILQEIAGLPSEVKKKYNLNNNFTIWHSPGCNLCGRTGYSGRMGIFEVLKVTKEVSDIILAQPDEKKLAQEAEKQGMITMRQDGIIKALEGLTSVEEVIRVTETQTEIE
ncbi:MAG: GspE/PulE family protein [Candidatus Paceibacterota bacterium]|jgi:type IV pilus assembly protein PilB|nr:GspE/PulE family protein [Candidatus Paceibacterota bacterium]